MGWRQYKYQESFEELAIAIQMKLNWLSCNEHRVIGSDNKNNYAWVYMNRRFGFNYPQKISGSVVAIIFIFSNITDKSNPMG